jgi:hypothetical protein
MKPSLSTMLIRAIRHILRLITTIPKFSSVKKTVLLYWLAIIAVPQIGWSQASFGGLGGTIEIDINKKFPFLVEIIKGSPADRMNLAPNDYIMKVDGISTYGKTIEQVAGMIKGPVGSNCSITITRGTNQYVLTFSREKMDADVVTTVPSCLSNARGWSIESITQTRVKTLVEIKIYRSSGTEISIPSTLYIEGAGTKYYIKRFWDNQLDKVYTLQPFTEYTFTLEFEKIPSYLTFINIKVDGPAKPNVTYHYFNSIKLNATSNERLKLHPFLLNSGIDKLASMAHPANKLRTYRYCVTNDFIWVDLFYHDKVHTELRIDKTSDNVFTGIRVLTDNDYYPTFKAFADLVNGGEDNDPNTTALLAFNALWIIY